MLIQVSIDPSSYQAASPALDILVGTVRSRLFRARSALHRLLDDPARDAGTRRIGRKRVN